MDCKDQHPNVAEDDHNCRDDEAQDEVVVHSQPAIVAGAVAAHLDGVKAHVFHVMVLVDVKQINDDGDDDNEERRTIAKDVKFPS